MRQIAVANGSQGHLRVALSSGRNRNDSPVVTSMSANLCSTVLDRVVAGPDGCWVWTGTTVHGHAQFSARVAGEPRTLRPARIVYEHFAGAISSELELDHLCHTFSDCVAGDDCLHRRCVNPWHLEPVTHAENSRRAHRVYERAERCKRGHELTGENVGINKRGRYCRKCGRDRARAWRLAHA